MKRQEDRAKQSGRSTTRNPGTARRPAGVKADAHARPFSSPDPKPPVRSPRAANKAPIPKEQPTKKKARAAERRQERHEEESTPRPHNVRVRSTRSA